MLASAALFWFLVLPSESPSHTQPLVAAMLVPLGWFPWCTGLSSQAAAWRLHAANAPAVWVRVLAALLLAEASLHVPLPGSGWGEGYAGAALGYLLIVGGGLSLTLTTVVGAVTASRDRPGPSMWRWVQGAFALAAIVSTLGVFHHTRRLDPRDYLDAFVDRFQAPNGGLCERPLPGAVEGAVRLSTTRPAAG